MALFGQIRAQNCSVEESVTAVAEIHPEGHKTQTTWRWNSVADQGSLAEDHALIFVDVLDGSKLLTGGRRTALRR